MFWNMTRALLVLALLAGMPGCFVAFETLDQGSADGTPYPQPQFEQAGCERDPALDYMGPDALACSPAFPQAWTCSEILHDLNKSGPACGGGPGTDPGASVFTYCCKPSE